MSLLNARNESFRQPQLNLQIAKAYLEPRGNQLELQPQAMWRLLGGTDGLPRLRRNAQVMLDLAVFVQRWNFRPVRT